MKIPRRQVLPELEYTGRKKYHMSASVAVCARDTARVLLLVARGHITLYTRRHWLMLMSI